MYLNSWRLVWFMDWSRRKCCKSFCSFFLPFKLTFLLFFKSLIESILKNKNIRKIFVKVSRFSSLIMLCFSEGVEIKCFFFIQFNLMSIKFTLLWTYSAPISWETTLCQELSQTLMSHKHQAAKVSSFHIKVKASQRSKSFAV